MYRGTNDPSVTGRTVTTTEETSESNSTSEGCGGVLSCGVDAIGAVIAFPFKALGAIVGAIF